MACAWPSWSRRCAEAMRMHVRIGSRVRASTCTYAHIRSRLHACARARAHTHRRTRQARARARANMCCQGRTLPSPYGRTLASPPRRRASTAPTRTIRRWPATTCGSIGSHSPAATRPVRRTYAASPSPRSKSQLSNRSPRRPSVRTVRSPSAYAGAWLLMRCSAPMGRNSCAPRYARPPRAYSRRGGRARSTSSACICAGPTKSFGPRCPPSYPTYLTRRPLAHLCLIWRPRTCPLTRPGLLSSSYHLADGRPPSYHPTILPSYHLTILLTEGRRPLIDASRPVLP